MKRYSFAIFMLAVCIYASAIDFPVNTVFKPSDLVGKTIVIPTYNGGDEHLNFVYNESVLESHKFTYKNYESIVVLGKPIRIVDYKIIDEGKKDETLCLIADVEGRRAVLAFPMYIKSSDFTGTVIAQLFYGKPLKVGSNYSQYSINSINLRYYMSIELDSFKKNYMDKTVFLGGSDGNSSNKQYKFEGFTFRACDMDFSGDEDMFWVVNSYRYFPLQRNNLDVLYAVLEGYKKIYIQIKDKGIQPFSENSVDISKLDRIVLDEQSFRQKFKPSLGHDYIESINKMINKEWFFPFQNVPKTVLLSKSQDFDKYDEVIYSRFSGHYIMLDSLAQIKTIDNSGNIRFDYYLTGKGSENNVFEDYVAIPLDNTILDNVVNGVEHRAQVVLEEQKRENENKERLAQLKREEQEYKSSLIRRYGLSNANLILNGEVRIGFTKAMCKEAWGEPSYINNTISSYGTWEQWVYGLGSYLYFNGNKLVVIQN